MEIKISFPTDEDGLNGRECPSCKKYFKVKFGTGIQDSVPCHCPYCNYINSHDHFWTKDQLDYAKSVAMNYATNEIQKSLKKLEVKPNRNQFISLEIKVKGKPTPIIRYHEKDLEQKVLCKQCTLEYAIYGKFGYCPDCGIHNSHEIFINNLEIFKKLLLLSSNQKPEISRLIIDDALKNSVSIFDGFCREILRLKDSSHKISFQNIENARKKILQSYNFDIINGIRETEWVKIIEAFQKRHLLSHKLGIIDEQYIKKTKSIPTLLGKRIDVCEEEVLEVTDLLKKIAEDLSVFVS